jgi:hypothetical protein
LGVDAAGVVFGESFDDAVATAGVEVDEATEALRASPSTNLRNRAL